MKKFVTIGAGMAGLGTAYGLRGTVDRDEVELSLIEGEDEPGGLCRTDEISGFHFDRTGHLLHLRNKVFEQLVRRLLGDNLLARDRSAWIYSHGVYTNYPFQSNLYGLPYEVIVECLDGFCDRYYGRNNRQVETFEDWIDVHFGPGIARHFMVPYNSKLYRCHPREMTPDCMGRFVPRPDIKQVFRGALSSFDTDIGYNAQFLYPKYGGTGSLIRAMAAEIPELSLGEWVTGIDPAARRVETSKGRTLAYDRLFSTQPLTALVSMLDSPPPEVVAAARALRHVSVLAVNLGVKEDLGNRHWIYVPEERYIFHRVGFFTNFSPYMAPRGHGSIYAEISYDSQAGIDRGAAERKAVEDLVSMEVITRPSAVAVIHTIDIPFAYAVFNSERPGALKTIRSYLERNAITSLGRFGSWHYTSMEDSFMEGYEAAARCSEA